MLNLPDHIQTQEGRGWENQPAFTFHWAVSVTDPSPDQPLWSLLFLKLQARIPTISVLYLIVLLETAAVCLSGPWNGSGDMLKKSDFALSLL